MEQNHDTQGPIEQENAQPTEPKDVPLPAPTLLTLVSGVAMQAMVSMGVFPNPVTGQTTILPNQAKHLIDTVVLIDEKTRGNQSDEEAKTISNVLHELRMIFVAAQNEKDRRDTEQ